MKWVSENCSAGDIVRVAIGSIHHYGIFVSENEVIAFGRPPIYYREHADEKIVVCSTDVLSFLYGGFLERGVPSRKEKKEMFSPEKIVERARSRLGESGYNPVHNNCEHFVYECAFGKKYSEQETKMREKWVNRPRFEVYVCFGGMDVGTEGFPPQRKKEIERVTNERLRAEKTGAWNLLRFAIRDYGLDPDEMRFCKSKDGCWSTKGLYFSITHSNGAYAVALSNAPCGVDMEPISPFEAKCRESSFAASFAERIGANATTPLALLKEWTGRESVFKRNGVGKFLPQQISLDETVRYVRIYDNLIAIAGANASFALYHIVENGKATLVEERCTRI